MALKTRNHIDYAHRSHSVRRVAGRHRPVARATQSASTASGGIGANGPTGIHLATLAWIQSRYFFVP